MHQDQLYQRLTYLEKERAAIDLDKTSFVADSRAINDVCSSMGITPYFELSKSGNGIHI